MEIITDVSLIYNGKELNYHLGDNFNMNEYISEITINGSSVDIYVKSSKGIRRALKIVANEAYFTFGIAE